MRKPKTEPMPTTAAVARSLGIEQRTLWRWLESGEFTAPDSIQHGTNRIFLWSPRDIQRLKKHVAKSREHWGSLRDVLHNWAGMQGQIRMGITAPKVFTDVGAGPQAMFQPTDELLTPQQLADRLQVKLSTVYELSRRRGRLRASRLPGREPMPCHKIGKFLRFSWQEIVSWMNRQMEAQRAGAK